MSNILNKETDWYILHSFKTNRIETTDYDELMRKKLLCNDLQIIELPNKDKILMFNWLKTVIFSKESKALGAAMEVCRRTSAIKRTEHNGKWFIVETYNSTYTFMRIDGDDVFEILIERLEENE